jgi:3-dehydroquinate synthase
MLFLTKMRRIDFHIEAGDSRIIVGESLSNVQSYIPEGKLFIITDVNVRKLYGGSFPKGVTFEIPSGEKSKCLSVVEDLCLRLAEAGADRHSFILGIGGGVVCDITGLVASLYMRGVRHGFVSTTLLSQVDASVGGKTGVNAGKLKNNIGTFKLPEFVICDVTMLATLSNEEFISGLGELIKSAVIADRDLFFMIREKSEKLLTRDTDLMEELVYKSLLIKTKIVSHDFKESGERRLLNFGHTLGHPLEMINKVPHGIAVMQGMILAGLWSVRNGILPETDFLELKSLISSFGVPLITDMPQGYQQLVSGDKKKTGDYLHFVCLTELGGARSEEVTLNALFEFLKRLPGEEYLK